MVPKIGTTSGPWPSSQASAICAGDAPTRVARPRNLRNERHVLVVVLALQPRLVAAEIGCGQFLGAGEGTGEEPAAERRVGDDADPQRPAGGQDLGLDPALPERILGLQRADRVHGVGAPERRCARFRQAEVADLPGLDELGHGAHDLLDRHGGVDAMLVEEVDPVGSQPTERSIDHLADAGRPAVEARNLAVGPDPEAELGRHDHPVPALALEQPSDQRFVGKWPVDLGGVEQR